MRKGPGIVSGDPPQRSEQSAATRRLICPSFCHEESDFLFVYADHSFTEILRQFCNHLSVSVVCNKALYDSGGSLCRVARLEDTGFLQAALSAEPHHQSGIGRSWTPPAAKFTTRGVSGLLFRNVLYKLIVDLKILCRLVKFVL